MLQYSKTISLWAISYEISIAHMDISETDSTKNKKPKKPKHPWIKRPKKNPSLLLYLEKNVNTVYPVQKKGKTNWAEDDQLEF